MKSLTIIKPTLDSREVAEMLGKDHKILLRDIEGGKDRKGIVEILGKNQMEPSEYFIKSSYKNSQNKEQPNYLITKLGCEMLGNKQQGEKGILFTAKYVKKFNEMENYISNDLIINSVKAEITSLINDIVSQKVEQIEEKCSEYFRPLAVQKTNIIKYIKTRLGSNDDKYDLVKQRVLIKLNATKWEDIPVETLVNSLNIIDESIRIINLDSDRQVSIWG